MPDTYDIKQLKLKTSPELSPSEKQYLIENPDLLNDEDKVAYADFLAPETVTPSPEDANLAAAAATAANAGNPMKEEAPVTTEAPTEPETPTTPEYATKADLDAFLAGIEAKLATTTPAPTQTVEDKAAIKKIFDADPDNWEQAAEKIAAYTENKIQERASEREKAQIAIGQQFTSQYNDLVKEKKAPALDTEEGKKFFQTLDTFGGQYNQTSMQAAYDLWSKIPDNQGGGLKLSPEKKQIEAQKQRAGAIGGGGGSETVAKPTEGKKYSDIAGQSMHQIINNSLS